MCLLLVDIYICCQWISLIWVINSKGLIVDLILISLKVAFNRAFLTPAGNIVTSEKLLVSGMKCDTSEPDYTKVGNAFFSSFTKALNNLCKPFPILFTDIYALFRSFYVCLIWSRIFNIEYLALISGCISLLSRMSSRLFVLMYPSSDSSYVYNLSIEDKIDSYSSALCSFYTKPPFSNCAKVIISPFFSWYVVEYGIYNTAGWIASASEYGLDVYAKALDFFRQIKRHVKKKIPCTRYVNEVPFLMLWDHNENSTKTFLWLMTHV